LVNKFKCKKLVVVKQPICNNYQNVFYNLLSTENNVLSGTVANGQGGGRKQTYNGFDVLPVCKSDQRKLLASLCCTQTGKGFL
jgi:hypothetical protein